MKISVIIPSRNRKELLKQCLYALSQQTIKPFEVLLVENNKKQSYKPLVSQFPDLTIRLLLQKRIGKSKARNMGIKKAKGKILSFLDDDCEPCKNWIKEIIKTFKKENLDVVLGHSLEKNKSLLIKAYTFQYQDFFLASRLNFSSGKIFCGGALNTRNFAIKKDFVLKNRVFFDKRFDKFGFAEDTDFGEQLEQKKASMYFNRHMRILHKEKDELLPLLKAKFMNGRAIAVLKNKGIFHDFRLAKKCKFFVFERTKKLIKNRSLKEITILILYLNFIIFSYKLGYWFERVKQYVAKTDS